MGTGSWRGPLPGDLLQAGDDVPVVSQSQYGSQNALQDLLGTILDDIRWLISKRGRNFWSSRNPILTCGGIVSPVRRWSLIWWRGRRRRDPHWVPSTDCGVPSECSTQNWPATMSPLSVLSATLQIRQFWVPHSRYAEWPVGYTDHRRLVQCSERV